MSSSAKSVKDLENPQKDGFLYKYGVKGINIIIISTINIMEHLFHIWLREVQCFNHCN